MSEDLKVGRELDAAVAVEVMGLSFQTHPYIVVNGKRSGVATRCRGEWDPERPPPGSWAGMDEVRHYSTDIADAWQVVEKLGDMGVGVTVQNSLYHDKPPDFFVSVCRIDDPADEDYFRRMVYGDTAPEAICRAALAAAREAKTEEVE